MKVILILIPIITLILWFSILPVKKPQSVFLAAGIGWCTARLIMKEINH
jgi:hypothetical protein